MANVSNEGLPQTDKQGNEQETEQEGEPEYQQQQVEDIRGLLCGLCGVNASQLDSLLTQITDSILDVLKTLRE